MPSDRAEPAPGHIEASHRVGAQRVEVAGTDQGVEAAEIAAEVEMQRMVRSQHRVMNRPELLVVLLPDEAVALAVAQRLLERVEQAGGQIQRQAGRRVHRDPNAPRGRVEPELERLRHPREQCGAAPGRRLDAASGQGGNR